MAWLNTVLKLNGRTVWGRISGISHEGDVEDIGVDDVLLPPTITASATLNADASVGDTITDSMGGKWVVTGIQPSSNEYQSDTELVLQKQVIIADG